MIDTELSVYNENLSPDTWRRGFNYLGYALSKG